MADNLQQLGILGLFVILLYREVVRPLVQQRVTNKSKAEAPAEHPQQFIARAGDYSPEYWMLRGREIADQAATGATDTVVGILDRQTLILAEIAKNQQEMILILRSHNKN